MAFVGYYIGLDGEGVPLAAAITYNEAFSKTLERITTIASGNVYALGSSQMSVQQRDLSEDEVAEVERIIAESMHKWHE